MFEVTAEKLRDWRLCRYLYHQKHDLGRLEHHRRAERDTMKDTLEDALNTLIAYKYFELMDGKDVTHPMLISKWEKLWLGDLDVETIRTSANSPGRNIHAYNSDALEMISRFHQSRETEQVKVLMLSEPYTIPITDTAAAHGLIGIALLRDNRPTLEYFTTKSTKSFNDGTEKMYQIILDSLAFTAKTGETPIYRITYLKTGHYDEGVISQLEHRQVSELTAEMETTTLFPAAHATYWCERGCAFRKDPCKKW